MSMLSTYFPMAAVAGIVTSSAKWSPEIFSSLLFQSSESGVWDERLAGFKLSWCLALTKHALISLALTVKRKKFPRRAVSWVFEKKSVWFRRLFSSKFNSRFVIFEATRNGLGTTKQVLLYVSIFQPNGPENLFGMTIKNAFRLPRLIQQTHSRRTKLAMSVKKFYYHWYQLDLLVLRRNNISYKPKTFP